MNLDDSRPFLPTGGLHVCPVPFSPRRIGERDMPDRVALKGKLEITARIIRLNHLDGCLDEGISAVPEEIRRIKITAVYDPKKTAVWFPGGLKPDHVHLQADPEDPEEETSERSVPHSILNTFLVIVFLSSIVFFMWKTGLLRWLKRFLEGLFIYG